MAAGGIILGKGRRVRRAARQGAIRAADERSMNMSDELNRIVEAVKGVPEKVKEALDKTDIDEKIVETVKGVPEKVKEALDKTDIDEKIIDGAKDLANKIGSLFSGKDGE